jgi:hypothetical protein
MKTAILKMGFIFLFLSLTEAGCDDNEKDLWKISPESKNAMIQQEVDGIEFKFCLLNEEGEPATVFNEGENFSFYFSVTNKRDEKLNFDAGFAQTNQNDFCDIYDSEDQNIGKPYNVLTVLMIGAGAYPFQSDTTYVFEVPWVDNRNDIWFWEKATYESSHREPLEKGDYYTGFKYRFRFARTHEEPSLITDTLSFKINFKIQ